MNTRGYSVLEIKSINEDERIIEGIASTPVTDRMEDVVEPMGGKFALPLPLKWQHGRDVRDPIGWVTHAKPTSKGIPIKAKFAKIEYPPTLKEELDRCWARTKAGLMTGLSIGFRGIDVEPIKGTLGLQFKTWEWLELSVVDVPANQDCNITSVKSADSTVRAALGTRTGVVRLDSTVNLPGVSGRTGNMKMKTTADEIKDFEAQLSAEAGKLTAVMAKARDEGRSLDDTEDEEFETLKGNIAKTKKHIARLHEFETLAIATATPITKENTEDPVKASETRGGRQVITVKSNLPKGTVFARYIMALANSKGDARYAADTAKQLWNDSTPEVELILRATVAAGTTTATTWAAPLIPAAERMQGEFIELLRPATIIGRIPGLKRVPANISVPRQTGGATFGWVGEGQAKPVSALAFDSVTLRWAKAAGIIVLTKELVKYSNPSAEQIVRDTMIKDTAKFLDAQFIDPTVAAVSNVSPASITNTAASTASTGTTAAAFEANFKTAIATFLTADDDPSDVVLLMSATVALNLSLLKNALGQREYPDISIQGGTILGFPVVISQAVGARIIFVKPSEILINDEGQVEIDMSEQASIVMDSLPQSSPVHTELVSLWQRNFIGLRAEKWIVWEKARTTSVHYISNAVYSG